MIPNSTIVPEHLPLSQTPLLMEGDHHNSLLSKLNNYTQRNYSLIGNIWKGGKWQTVLVVHSPESGKLGCPWRPWPSSVSCHLPPFPQFFSNKCVFWGKDIVCYAHDRHSVNSSGVNWLTQWHRWATDSTLTSHSGHSDLEASYTLSLPGGIPNTWLWVKLGAAVEARGKCGAPWAMGSSLYHKQGSRIEGLLLSTTSRQSSIKALHLMGSQLHLAVSKATRLQLKCATWQWNQGFCLPGWRLGMLVAVPFPPG